MKPEWIEDEVIAGLEHDTLRLWFGMFSLADDEGRLRAAPDYLEGNIFWGKPCDDIGACLRELTLKSLMVLYEHHGQQYAVLPSFLKHQKIDHPTESRLPGPSSQLLAKSREVSRDVAPLIMDLGSRIIRNTSGSPHQPTLRLAPTSEAQPAPAKSPTRTRPGSRSGIERIIDHYTEKHPRSRPGLKERRLIRARLEEGYSVDALCVAIDGCHVSPHHLGKTTGTRYLALSLIMRDSCHVTQFIEILERHQDNPGGSPARQPLVKTGDIEL